jgi:tetratricopeptide (TPR) repeat protein
LSGSDRVSQPAQAIDWFRRAASHGNNVARVALGRLLSDVRSPAEIRNPAEGYAWWVVSGDKSAADLKKRLSPSELAEGEKLARDIVELDRIRAKALGLDDLQVLQKQFAESPNFQDCVVILDRVGHILKQYDRSIEYGNRCLELPRESKDSDWLIHYWLADFYNKNSDVEHSMFHLRLALKLDAKNTILKNNWFSQSGLEGIYAKIKH